MEDFNTFMNKPLSTSEIILILVIILFLIFIMIFIDNYFMVRKAKKIPKKHPDAALIYLYIEGEPAEKGKLNCLKGVTSSLFNIPASKHPDGKKGLGFYCKPGLVNVNISLKHKKINVDYSVTNGHISFNAEPNGVYRINLHLNGHIEMVLLKGKEMNFIVKDEDKKVVYNYEMKQPASQDIIRCFYIKEFLRLVFSCGFIYLMLLYLVLYCKVTSYALLFPLGLFLLTLCMMFFIGTKNYKRVFDSLTEQLKENIKYNFIAPHPIYKLFFGEVHLLEKCIICRHGGRLSLILMDQITTLRSIQYQQSYGMAKSLIIQINTGKKYQIEFWGAHKKDLMLVVEWIREKNPNVLEM